ncbi:MAG: response regulator transcription factor, partial [Deltaproteobacteria bacterium]|nr:response regulator transcription factor [Deltaproteobacteria bacterium]
GEPELAKIREAFLAVARERAVAAAAAVEAVAKAPRDPEPVRGLRAGLRWLAAWGALHGFPGASDLARRGDDEVTAEVLSGFAPDPATVARWRSLVGAVADELAAPQRAGGAGPRCVLFTKRAEAFGPGGGRGALLPGCEVAGAVDRAVGLLADRSIAAIVLDLAAPMPEVLEVVAAARACGSPLRPLPAVVAVGDAGILDRFRVTQAGADAVLPAGAPPSDVARAVSKALAGREVVRGTALVLGPDLDLKDRIERDLSAEGYRAIPCADLTDLLRRFIEARPDLVLVAASRTPAAALQVVKDLRDAPHARHLPIVVALDPREPEQRKAAMEAGADDWLPVPYLLPELLARACRAVEVRDAVAARRGGESAGGGVAAAARAVEGVVGALGGTDPDPARQGRRPRT